MGKTVFCIDPSFKINSLINSGDKSADIKFITSAEYSDALQKCKSFVVDLFTINCVDCQDVPWNLIGQLRKYEHLREVKIVLIGAELEKSEYDENSIHYESIVSVGCVSHFEELKNVVHKLVN